MSIRGKKRVKCSHPGCDRCGYLTITELSCIEDLIDPTWMCERHDGMRTMRQCMLALEGGRI